VREQTAKKKKTVPPITNELINKNANEKMKFILENEEQIHQSRLIHSQIHTTTTMRIFFTF